MPPLYLATPTSNLLPILRQPHGRSAEWATLIRWVNRQEVANTVVTWNNNARTKYGKQKNLKALCLSPVGPAPRSLPSVLQPGYSESPDAQSSSLCWGTARPPIRVYRNLWPFERLRGKSLSFRKLQKKAKINCTYCLTLKRTALTFTFQVVCTVSEQTFRTLECLGLCRCIHHLLAVAILYMLGLLKYKITFMKISNRPKIQETRNIINCNAQTTTELWSNVFLTEINVLLSVNIKRCDFPLYSHCQGQTFPRSVDSNNSIDWSLSVGLSQCVCCCSPSVQQSDMDKFHCQLVAQCLYLVCHTLSLHVSARMIDRKSQTIGP